MPRLVLEDGVWKVKDDLRGDINSIATKAEPIAEFYGGGEWGYYLPSGSHAHFALQVSGVMAPLTGSETYHTSSSVFG